MRKEATVIPAIEKLPRVSLGFYPTPITNAAHLSSRLEGPTIFIKREDLSGLALGGNKCRKLEFILAEAQRQGATAVISTASSQSNFCLQLAAAGRKLGMKPAFALIKGVHTETQGNLLLHNILGSDVEILEVADMSLLKGDFIQKKWDDMAAHLKAKGLRPFIMRHNIPDISAILGVVGWVNAADELDRQFKSLGISPNYVALANGGGGTQAGLELGSRYLGTKWKVVGFSVLNSRAAAVQAVAEQANAASDYLHLGVNVSAGELEVYDDYIGKGYGIPTEAGIEAIRTVAQTEAIFIDPVYTSKAMSGVIDLVKRGRFKRTDTIVFVHTGGIAATFAYDKEIAR
jgi:D-cysteine desulfhydrase family pyridoxal phosphate-dependent enzyme